jgi:NADH:ubiquinone oxidoreductase subunit H
LSEYAMLLYSCFLIVFIFFTCLVPLNPTLNVLFAMLVSFVFIWIRITFCRFRYDMLMMMSWKILLPFSINLFLIMLFAIL